MSIELLTSSAEAYVSSQGKPLTAYEMIGLDATEETEFRARNIFEERAKVRGCEVVVDIRISPNPGKPKTLFDIGSAQKYTIIGTGLILK